MKTFFSTVFAILVAAGIIWFVASVYQARQQVATRREHIRELTLDGDIRQAQREWEEQRRRNPQFDPNAEKLTARLREIREASDAGTPIPPSPWKQKPSGPPQQEQQQPDSIAIAEPPPPRPAPKLITITRPVSIKIPYGELTLQPGTQLQLVSREGQTARVHYMGADQLIPISATDLK